MFEPYGPVVGEIVLRHVPLFLVDFENTIQDLFAYPNLGHTHLRKEGGRREGEGRGKERDGRREREGEGRREREGEREGLKRGRE